MKIRMKRTMFFLKLLLLIPFLSACTLFQKKHERLSQKALEPNAAVATPPSSEAHVTQTPFAEGEVVVSELGQVPIEINQKVISWIEYFQTRGRRHMFRYLGRSSQYMDLMKRILKEEGVPQDLVYIALIESGFNTKAHSRASAVGFWQFIRGTGKRYGLKINGYVDERRDVALSTRAAANYFKSLYNLFGNWYLAMASYNVGENRIKHLVMKYHTRDFWKLAREKRIPRETANYVPKYLAASMIAKNPSKYGFDDVIYDEKVEYEEVQLLHGIDLRKFARKMHVSYKDLKKLNPSVRGSYLPAYRGRQTSVKIPRGMTEVATYALSYAKAKAKYIRAENSETFTYRVRRGDNLSTIARRYGTSVRSIKRINHLRRSSIRIGQRLKIPERYGSQRSVADAKEEVTLKKEATPSGVKYHKVKRGESLWLIAKKYKMKLSQLMKLNQLSRRSVIKVGMKLKVKAPNSSENNEDSKVHVVRRGETLSHIARKYKVRISKLAKVNSIKRRSRIYAGLALVIPE